ARLASGVITFEQVGPELPKKVVAIPFQKAVFENGKLKGTIAILDIQYGNIWTNIGDDLVNQLKPAFGSLLHVVIFHNKQKTYEGDAPYSQTFGAVEKGRPLSYLNSLLQLSFALNQASFADVYKISSGSDWSVEVSLASK
ncbi:MAG: SAM hydroxide adenosyltransferase, partial [Mucilaginibacter sp.]